MSNSLAKKNFNKFTSLCTIFVRHRQRSFAEETPRADAAAHFIYLLVGFSLNPSKINCHNIKTNLKISEELQNI